MLWGQSGKLRAVFTLPGESPVEGAAPRMGSAGTAPQRPGIYNLASLGAGALSSLGAGADALHWFVLAPFSAKVHGRIGSYRMGLWPFERRAPSDAAYANPRGFIEVTPENVRTKVSEHFSIGEV